MPARADESVRSSAAQVRLRSRGLADAEGKEELDDVNSYKRNARVKIFFFFVHSFASITRERERVRKPLYCALRFVGSFVVPATLLAHMYTVDEPFG